VKGWAIVTEKVLRLRVNLFQIAFI
jgi:hypothetical protein